VWVQGWSVAVRGRGALGRWAVVGGERSGVVAVVVCLLVRVTVVVRGLVEALVAVRKD